VLSAHQRARPPVCGHTPRMDVDIDVCRALGAPSREDGRPSIVRIQDEAFRHPRWGEALRQVLDGIGERSRRAQGLGKAVTYGSGNVLGSCRVYLLAHRNTVFGVLKVGPKRLFVAKGVDEGLVEINPQCVLDFYVVEGHQRGGLGATLFRAMLAREGIRPEKFAYDRPSPKLLGFLRKHFGLVRFQAQSNNFVVFDAYFAAAAQGGGPPSALKPRAGSSSGEVGGGSARRRAPSAPLLGPRFQATEDSSELPEAVGVAAGLGPPGRSPPPLEPACADRLDELVAGPSMRRTGPSGPQSKPPPPAPMPTPHGTAPQPRPPLAGGGVGGKISLVKPQSSGSHPSRDPPPRHGCPPGASGGNPLRTGGAGGNLPLRRTARSASPLTQAAKNSLAAPSPLVQAMAAGLRI